MKKIFLALAIVAIGLFSFFYFWQKNSNAQLNPNVPPATNESEVVDGLYGVVVVGVGSLTGARGVCSVVDGLVCTVC